jgi:hypothetical protein
MVSQVNTCITMVCVSPWGAVTLEGCTSRIPLCGPCFYGSTL